MRDKDRVGESGREGERVRESGRGWKRGGESEREIKGCLDLDHLI